MATVMLGSAAVTCILTTFAWMRVLALLLLAVSGLTSGNAWARDRLTIGISQFPSTFHPNIDAMMAKSYVLGLTRRPFTVFDPAWNLTCMLCVELPTFENGGAVRERAPNGNEGVAVTYTIRENARWGDGRAITSDDVMFTWTVGRHQQSGVGNSEFYRSLYKIDVVDARTFTLHFDKLTFEYNAINDFNLLPKHLEQEPFADPTAYRTRTRFDADTTNPGLYFGPYRIREVATGSHILLEPNPTWWGPVPPFKEIVVRVIENTAALEANLLSGGIDMIAGELGITLDQALSFEQRHGSKFKMLFKPGLIFEHIDLNLDNPVLADVRVRRAIAMAIDREAISKQLFAGRQPVAKTGVSPLDWVYADDILGHGYDPQRAGALLADAGWNRGRGGVLINGKGEPLRLELAATAGNRSRELIAQVLQGQWRALGIEARIRTEPARVFFGQTVSQRRFPDMAMFAWISAPENVPRTTLHSEQIPTAANNWAGQNYTGFKNPEMDSLIERIEIELDREKRRELWRRLQELYVQETPAIPLFFRADAYVLPLWLTGVEPTGHLAPTTLWVERWRANP
jgi:peptide/nickel transport system substrate-binding protein